MSSGMTKAVSKRKAQVAEQDAKIAELAALVASLAEAKGKKKG